MLGILVDGHYFSALNPDLEAREHLMSAVALRAKIRRLPTELPISVTAYAGPGAHRMTLGTASAIATGAALPLGGGESN